MILLQENTINPELTPVTFEYKANPAAGAFTSVTTYNGSVGQLLGDAINNPTTADFGAGSVPVTEVGMVDSNGNPYVLLLSVLKFASPYKTWSCALQTYV